jgi:hypothetical protein
MNKFQTSNSKSQINSNDPRVKIPITKSQINFNDQNIKIQTGILKILAYLVLLVWHSPLLGFGAYLRFGAWNLVLNP